MRKYIHVLLSVVLALYAIVCGAQNTPVSHVINANNTDVFSGLYAVVFKQDAVTLSDVPDVASAMIYRSNGTFGHNYQHIFKGFTARLSPEAAAALTQDPRVAYVEQVPHMYTAGIETSPNWGLDRIDQRHLPLNNKYSYQGDGTNVTAFVVDTGILLTHQDFGGRAVSGYDFFSTYGVSYCPGNPAYTVPGTDVPGPREAGHATHVAGTIGGATYGVAKNVTLVDVKVMDCWGEARTASGVTDSSVYEGLEWILAHGIQNFNPPWVVNLSIQGSHDPVLDGAVRNLINAGVVPVIAAGNSGSTQCLFTLASPATPDSPADVNTATDTGVSAPSVALVVGATTSSDSVATSYSNQGCANIFAPGTSITSDWDTSNTATAVESGTSMVTPHVVGAVARYFQNHPPSSTPHNATVPTDAYNYITDNATQNALSGVASNTPDSLLFEFGPPNASLVYGGCNGSSSTYNGTWTSSTPDVTYDVQLQPYGATSWLTEYDSTSTSGSISVGPNEEFRIRVSGYDNVTGEQSDFTVLPWRTASCTGRQ